MRDYYVVSVVVGGIIYKTGAMLLGDAELAVKTFLMCCPNSAPQILFDSSM